MNRFPTLLPALALAGAWIAAPQAGAAPPARSSAPRPAAPRAAQPRVIVVGWDGADWQLLDPLMAEGKLPNLAALVAKGRTWRLDSFEPMASPLIWTTMATGRTPVDHGVTDFQEVDPKTRARLPISGRSRRVPAIWNLAAAKGVSVGVVGWWATWPAERVKGFLVSDRAAPMLFDPETLSKSPALTWPEGLADGVRLVARREGSPGYDDVKKGLDVTRAEFDAAVAKNEALANPITGYQKILGSTRTYAKTALDLYDREKPDLLMVYFEGTDEIGHLLARYVPPKPEAIPEDEFRRYKGGVAAFYVEADRILGAFRERAERDGATLVLVSDHGFKWGKDRPAFYSSIQFDTAFLWHESPGVMAAAGPGVAPAAARGQASVFDVTPTLCRLLGLPADPKFEGKPVAGLETKALPPPAAPVAWARAAKVERLVVATDAATEKKSAEEFTKKLISLGYLTGAEASAVDARPPDRAGTETAGAFQNAGTFLRARGKPLEAVSWYRKALEVNPKSATAWMNLSIAQLMLKRHDESDESLLQAAKNGYHDPESAVFRRVSTYMKQADADAKAHARLTAFLRKASAAFPENDRYRSALGKALFEEQRCPEAAAIFDGILARRPRDPDPLNMKALVSLCLGRPADARELFQRSLAIDPNQPAIRQGLAEIERGGHASR